MNRDSYLNIVYNHEFISNKIKDELILHNIWSFEELEQFIIQDVYKILDYNIGFNRNVNTLSGGQRSVAYLVTCAYIIKEKNIKSAKLMLTNVLESLSPKTRDKIISYLTKKNIKVLQ